MRSFGQKNKIVIDAEVCKRRATGEEFAATCLPGHVSAPATGGSSFDDLPRLSLVSFFQPVRA